MVDNRKTLIEILKVSISNIVVLMSGVLVGFLLPKVVGVTDYGYYKTYTLYATYVGMFHFGIIDGIYLKYGGCEFSSLDRNKFKFYSKVFMVIETSISLCFYILSYIYLNGEYQFIFMFLGIYLMFHNITVYYQGISQATSRFTELSSRNIIQSILICIAVIGLFFAQKFFEINISYRMYIVLYTLIIAALTVWYIYTYRSIIFGRSGESYWKDIPEFVLAGFPLMLANLCSSLILTLDRQFVNALFDTDTYAVYAFAYNMLSLVTTAISAISTVIYPKLKQMNGKALQKQYTDLISTIVSLVFGCLLIYFPLVLFVDWFLPKYSDSLIIFRIIFPGLAISSAITIVMHNYYKVLGVNLIFFIKSIAVLVVSALSNYVAYKIFRTTIAISVASIATMIFWYLLVEYYFIRRYRIKWLKNFLYVLAMMSMFYLITSIQNIYIGFTIYFIMYLIITLLFNLKMLKQLIKEEDK